MRKIILLLLLFVATDAISQDAVRDFNRRVRDQKTYLEDIEKEIRKEDGRAFARALFDPVWDAFNRAAEQAKTDLEAGYDVVTDPIEAIDLTPLFDVRPQGDWGADWMDIENRFDEIRSRAQRPVHIVIFDTGRPVHRQLNDIRDDTWGQNWTSSPGDDDLHSHATHCSGIAAGADGDSQRSPVAAAGKLSIGWQKVLSDGGSGSYAWIADAVKHQNKYSRELIGRGHFVIYSFSLGGGTTAYQPLEDGFKEAVDMGVLILNSAGNTGSYITYPGLSPHVQAIGALQKSGTDVIKAGYSAFGEKLWGSTPGSSVYSTLPGDGYGFKSGTSMACPYAAQVFSILASIYPGASAGALIRHLETYGTDIPPTGRDDQTGFGWPVINRPIDNAPGDEPPPPPPPAEEICDNGRDDDGDGLVDCDDPDCSDHESCEPDEPDPEPPPAKPQRDYIATYPLKGNSYKTYYVVAGENGKRHNVQYTITVKGTTKELMDLYADKLELAMDAYVRNRSYGLMNNSDMWDALLWISYFTDLLLDKNSGMEIEQLGIEGFVDGRYVQVTGKDLKQVGSSTRSFFQKLFNKDLKMTKQMNADWWSSQGISY